MAIFIFSIFMLLSVGFLLLSPFLVRFGMLFRSFFMPFRCFVRIFAIVIVTMVAIMVMAMTMVAIMVMTMVAVVNMVGFAIMTMVVISVVTWADIGLKIFDDLLQIALKIFHFKLKFSIPAYDHRRNDRDGDDCLRSDDGGCY